MKRHNLSYYIEGLENQNTVVLAQAITLVESKKRSDNHLAIRLMDHVVKNEKRTFRIGITGTPGVGKSSFIEVFGNFLIQMGKRVAVLAVDPSSQKAGGSILGDKTRMDSLSINPDAYIRPSSSGTTLGGVNNNTREAILLCEAAGYDVILVETVGVGQSETMVHNMVDFFLLMIQPGSGDDLQGIKKGIMEMAHGIAINKADGDQQKLAKQSRVDLLSALHLFAPEDNGWSIQVQMCSALNKSGLEDIWKMISDYVRQMKKNGAFQELRGQQNVTWFEDRVEFELLSHLLSNEKINDLKASLSAQILDNKLSVSSASRELIAVMKEAMAS